MIYIPIFIITYIAMTAIKVFMFSDTHELTPLVIGVIISSVITVLLSLKESDLK